MNWSESARSALETCLAQYIEDPSSQFRELAAEHHALPIVLGIGGMSLLAPDGRVIALDDSNKRTSWSDPEWTFLIYIRAAQKFPALSMLLPERPRDAPACSDCGGTGWFSKLPSALCGTCSGLGWVGLRSNSTPHTDAREAPDQLDQPGPRAGGRGR